MSDRVPSHLELLARLTAIEARLAAVETTLMYGAGRRDCGCLPNTVCWNVACPRRVTVTCAIDAAMGDKT